MDAPIVLILPIYIGAMLAVAMIIYFLLAGEVEEEEEFDEDMY